MPSASIPSSRSSARTAARSVQSVAITNTKGINFQNAYPIEALPCEQCRSISKYRLHIVGEHVGFVNFQIIDVMTGFVSLHSPIDRFFQSEWGVSFCAHVCAVAFARGAQLKTGNDASVITNY